MTTMNDIEMRMADMDIENEENEELIIEEGVEEEINRFELCLVGRFLTEKNINIRVMKSKMADIWKPAMGISIKDLKPGLFLFQFYHKDDVQWVVNGGLWSFDNALLVLNTIGTGEDPTKVPLVAVDFWIQIHNLPMELMSEAIGKQLGNFFGTFLQYDSNNNSSIWREFMRLRIRVDVRKPLKRKKKICRRDRTEVVVNCKYEKLGDFCFICGLLSHTERFCTKKLDAGSMTTIKEWGIWLRAPPRRTAGGGRSKWLREEGDEDWGGRKGKDNYNQQHSEIQIPDIARTGSQRQDKRDNSVNVAVKTGKTDMMIFNSNSLEGNKTASYYDGLDKDELDGLNVENVKRPRNEAHEFKSTVNQSGVINKDSVLSNIDCTGASSPILATLARQASQAP